MKDRAPFRLIVSVSLFALLLISQVSGAERIIIQGNPERALLEQTSAENGVALLDHIRLEHLGVELWEIEGDEAQIVLLAENIRSISGVDLVERDILYSIQSRPNDPEYSKQWNLGSQYVANGSNRQSAGSSVSPVVALIDANHMDLQNNLW